MSDGTQVYAKASPSTLASVTKDLGDTRSRMMTPPRPSRRWLTS